MRSGAAVALALIGALVLVACGSVPPRSASTSVPPATRPGAFYQDDGPGERMPANLDQIADAIPRAEPYSRTANRPYVVFGQEYRPDVSDQSLRQRGIGSWYGRKFHGQRTSSGEIYDMYAMTAAHPTLPIPSYVRVTHAGNGRSIIVRVNDRGPFLRDRVIDLSFAAAYKLGYANQGSASLELERLLPADILAGRYAAPTQVYAALPASVPAGAPMPAAIPAQHAGGEPPTALAAAVVLPEVPLANALPVVAPVQQVVPAVAVAGGFVLQLGAFRNQAGAEELRIKLGVRLAGLADRLQVQQGGDFYRVLLGPYRDRTEADSVASQVRTMLDINALVVPRR